MSTKQPLKFSAGGSKSPKPVNRQNTPPLPSSSLQPTQPQTQRTSQNNAGGTLSVLQTGLTLKQSPFHLKNWIACVLTLDGRDKFTKVLQYSCRLLSWWFAVAASGVAGGKALDAPRGSNVVSFLHQTNRHKLYTLLSYRFQLLYKSFVESRKAFRMGRTFIEYDKLRSMGWGEYLMGVMSRPLGEGVAGESTGGLIKHHKHEVDKEQYPTHPIPEHHDEDNSIHEDRASWNEEEDSDEEEKKLDVQQQKVISRPGRPHLPSRVSSNIGWGPGTASTVVEKESSTPPSSKTPPARTVSELGTMYRSSRSSSLGWVKKSEGTFVAVNEVTSPPAWKLIGTTLKLFGLMGFWTFDNFAFLTGTGFLDPIHGNNTGDAKSLRMNRKKSASEWGARFYFIGSIAGLYVNIRGVWEHAHGALRKAREELNACLSSQSTNTEEVAKSRLHLKKTETKHFELYLALLKSICDCIVFSNNPGVDLHLKFRGKKNHEGLHCCCGLVSAGTVLFGNFPNA